MIAAQLSLALTAVEAFYRVDRRQIIIAGALETVEQLQAEGFANWKPVPPCFRQASDPNTARIVGSFDGTPVAVHADWKAVDGLGLFINAVVVGGLYYPITGGPPVSYHVAGGEAGQERYTEHPQAIAG